MKVTALLPDELVKETKATAGTDTITEALVIALTEWCNLKKIETLNNKVKKNPLKFAKSAKRAYS